MKLLTLADMIIVTDKENKFSSFNKLNSELNKAKRK